MYGDTHVIRQLAAQLDEQSAVIRMDSQRLVQAAATVAWAGRSAEAMRASMAERAENLQVTADLHRRAAERLRVHATRVEEQKQAIAWIADRVQSMLDGALHRLADLAAKAVDLVTHANPLDLRLRDLVLPPPGHIDWLRLPDLLPEVSWPATVREGSW